MRILITGSSGYIGRTLSNYLKDKRPDFELWGLDCNPPPVLEPLETDLYLSDNIMNVSFPYKVHFDTVVHLAAYVKVNESVNEPIKYYHNNIQGTENVLKGLKYSNFIYASTGTAENPINPYALSKRVGEDYVTDFCTKNTKEYTKFRFYNVTGQGYGIKPTNTDGLLYNLIKAKETGKFTIFGDDYNTPDGTAVRDYLHVIEICEAIEKAIDYPSCGLENLGHGIGYTVKEVAETFRRVNNLDFEIEISPLRRKGDLESMVLKDISTYMRKDLYTLDQMMEIHNAE